MKTVSIILWWIVVWVIVSFARAVRNHTLSGSRDMQTVNQAMLYAVQAAVAAIFGLNSLHFLWMIPLAFIIGKWSLAFPLAWLSVLGNAYARLCCIGLDRKVVKRNTERVDYVRRLLAAGHSRDEAIGIALDKYPVDKAETPASTACD